MTEGQKMKIIWIEVKMYILRIGANKSIVDELNQYKKINK